MADPRPSDRDAEHARVGAEIARRLRSDEQPGWLGPAALALLLAGAWVSWWQMQPPAPVPAGAHETRFSAGRAMAHVERIAARPHMTGTEEHARVRRYVVGQLGELGFDVEVHRATSLARFQDVVRAVTVRSIVARRPGADSSGTVALAAHYDSQMHTPGAGDDAAGVAAILEGVRAALATGPLRNDLVVLVTDGEELGLMGARAFVEEHPLADEIDVLFNFEARGGGGPSVAFETTEGNGRVVRELAAADPHAVGTSFFYEIYRLFLTGRDTDFSHFKELDLAGINFAFADDADVYHRMTDTPENLSGASLQHHGEHVAALTRRFGDLDLEATRSADVVFFNLPGVGLVTYPVSWVLPIFAAVALLFIGVPVVGNVRGGLGIGAVVVGVLLVLVGGGLGAGTGWLLWKGVSARHAEYGSLVGRELYGESWYMLALVAFVLAEMAVLYGLARTRCPAPGLVYGALLPAAVAAGMAAVFMPGAAMVVTWPALSGLVAVLWLIWRSPPGFREPAGGGNGGGPVEHRERPVRRDAGAGGGERRGGGRRGVSDLLALGAPAAPALVFQVPLVWSVFVGLGLSAAPALAAMCALLVALVLPLLELTLRRNRWWLPVLAVLAGIASTSVGLAGAGSFDARHPAPSSLFYVLDLRDGEAIWATFQEAGDAWLRRFVGDDAPRRQLGDDDLVPRLSEARVAAAPVLDATPPGIEVLEDTVSRGTRSLVLALHRSPAVQMLELWPVSVSGELRLLTVDGRPVPPRREARSGSADEPPAAARPPWILEHLGWPEGAVRVRLEAPAGTPVALEVLQHRAGLPDLAGGPDLRRPDDLSPDVRAFADRTLVRSRFTVPSAPAGGVPR